MLDFLITRFPFLSVAFIELRMRTTYLQDELIRIRTENANLKEELAKFRSALLSLNQAAIKLLETNNQTKAAYHLLHSQHERPSIIPEPDTSFSSPSDIAAAQFDQLQDELPAFISAHLERMEKLHTELEQLSLNDPGSPAIVSQPVHSN